MKTIRLRALILGLGLLTTLPHASRAADIPSPGTNEINGVVRFTNVDPNILAVLGPPDNEGMTSFGIVAYTDPPDALLTTKNVVALDPLAQAYAVTVAANDVPLVYNTYAQLSLDLNYEVYWTATQATTPLTSNSPPATVNFDECVGLIDLQYQDSTGFPVAASGGRGLAYAIDPPYGWRAWYPSQPAGRPGNRVVVPSGVALDFSYEVDTGTDIYSDRLTHADRLTVNLGCDEWRTLTVTLPDATALGSISGNANMVGELELPTEGYLELLSRPVMKAAGPSGNRRYAALPADYPGPDADRAYTLPNLVPSTATETWNVWTEMQLGTGYRFESFRSPGIGEGRYNPGINVTAGANSDAGNTFVMDPARLTGRITLTGPPETDGLRSALRGLLRSADFDIEGDGIPDFVGASGINGSYVVVSGVDELAPDAVLTTVGGTAAVSFEGAFNPGTSAFEGDYIAVLGNLDNQPGIWRMDGISISLSHPGTDGGAFVDQSIYVQEVFPWIGVLAPGGGDAADLRYGLAEVCLRIKSPAPFFYPRISQSTGGQTGVDSTGEFRAYSVTIAGASAPPYDAANATNEATVTVYLPEGTYALRPAISIPDGAGGVSEVQLPLFNLSVVARERVCLEECIDLVIDPPVCTDNTGFLTFARATSCDGSLTNLSLTINPLGRPEIRLGYSDIRILAGSRSNLIVVGQVFPEFDGFNDPSLYENMVYTAIARDNQGRVATRQIIASYDYTPPMLECPTDITVFSPDGLGVAVDFSPTAVDDRPGTVLVQCDPPGGTVFPVGTTVVTCTASDLCHNTNTCSFSITVLSPGCPLVISLSQLEPALVKVSWECPGVLESAPDVEGPWTEVPGAISPFVTAADEKRRFFRLRFSP